MGYCRGICSDPRTSKKINYWGALSANNTIEQIQPVISKIDVVDEPDPTVKQLPALMQKVDEAAENANTPARASM